MRVQIKTEGFKELVSSLRALEDELRTKILGTATLQAAKVVQEDAKRRAPVLQKPDRRRRAGTLRDAIKTGRMRDRNIDGAAARVYVRMLSGKKVSEFKGRTGRSSTENPDDPFYARFVEYGTSKIRAKPFLRPAFESQRGAAIDKMRSSTKMGLQNAARKRGLKTRG
jgi:HK97 gp10 family phage protein